MSAGVKKAVRLSIVIAILGTIILAVWWYWPRHNREARLSPTSEQATSRFALPAEPIYLQGDPRWAKEKIGGSGESLKSVGCTICCLSMALAHHSIALEPAELNEKFKKVGGFTESGWVKWDAVKQVSAGKVCIDLPSNPSHQDIDDALAKGDPVLVKVLLLPGVPHWILLVGRDQKEYLMKNPSGNGKTLEVLSSLQRDIRAIRIVRKIKA